MLSPHPQNSIARTAKAPFPFSQALPAGFVDKRNAGAVESAAAGAGQQHPDERTVPRLCGGEGREPGHRPQLPTLILR